MATHRDYTIVRWGADSALVLFYEGEYADVTDPNTGAKTSEYGRGPHVAEKLYTFDGDCTYERLVAFLNDQLERVGDLPSIAEQVRQRAPAMAAVRERSL